MIEAHAGETPAGSPEIPGRGSDRGPEQSASHFPAGFGWNSDGQIFRPVGLRPHTRKDGSLTTLVEWESSCAKCSKPFAMTTPLQWRFRHPTRHCPECRSPDHPPSRPA